MSTTILVIEDNPGILDNFSEILELADYKVLRAANGMQGLETARQHHPDLILSDIAMPELDGYGMLRALQNNPELTGIPVIFITGEVEKNNFRNAMDRGADDFLVKPVSGDMLLKVVATHLKKSQRLENKYLNKREGIKTFISEARSLHNISIFTEKQTSRKFRKKEFVFNESDPADFLYYVQSGKIKTFKTNYWGKEFITDMYKQGDFFGYLSLYDNGLQKESAMAIDDSQVILISKQDFFSQLHSNPEISEMFIKMLSKSLSEADEKLMNLAYDSARKRVAEALVYISNKYPLNEKKEVSFPVHRENISAIAGLSPESVSRNLTDLRTEGLIKIVNGEIKIPDLKKLENLKW